MNDRPAADQKAANEKAKAEQDKRNKEMNELRQRWQFHEVGSRESRNKGNQISIGAHRTGPLQSGRYYEENFERHVTWEAGKKVASFTIKEGGEQGKYLNTGSRKELMQAAVSAIHLLVSEENPDIIRLNFTPMSREHESLLLAMIAETVALGKEVAFGPEVEAWIQRDKEREKRYSSMRFESRKMSDERAALNSASTRGTFQIQTEKMDAKPKLQGADDVAKKTELLGHLKPDDAVGMLNAIESQLKDQGNTLGEIESFSAGVEQNLNVANQAVSAFEARPFSDANLDKMREKLADDIGVSEADNIAGRDSLINKFWDFISNAPKVATPKCLDEALTKANKATGDLKAACQSTAAVVEDEKARLRVQKAAVLEQQSALNGIDPVARTPDQKAALQKADGLLRSIDALEKRADAQEKACGVIVRTPNAADPTKPIENVKKAGLLAKHEQHIDHLLDRQGQALDAGARPRPRP